MNDDAKSQLKKILGIYDEKLAEATSLAAANRAAALAFPERFAALRSNTIRPALQEFADVLNGCGHEVTVRELEESTSSSDGVTFAMIGLRVVPKALIDKAAATATKKAFVEASFSANRNERKVTVSSTNTMKNSSGSVGKRGEYDIDAVTCEIVEAHVLHALREAFA